jgi:HEAT repeat protein
MTRCRLGAGLVLSLTLVASVAGRTRQTGVPTGQTEVQAGAPDARQVSAAIDALGSFDFPTRTAAARTVRRAPAAAAVPALTRAAQAHADGYVRYRALVLLAGFGDDSARDVMRQLIGDGNDRLREVVYHWFEHHPDPAVVPMLVDALSHERSEFVRPALSRALAANGDDPRVRAVLVPLVLRGEDAFRGAIIDALGDYHGGYAAQTIAEVARLDGPLQDDAVTAIGKLGDPAMLSTLADIQRGSSRDLHPTLAAAECLLGVDCASHEDYLKKTLIFAATTDGYQSLLRGASHALGVLAVAGHAGALDALVDRGVPATDPARGSIALAVGLVALRNPSAMLQSLEGRADRDAAIELLRDAFDLLSSEDFEQELFYVAVRHAYWEAPAGSARRQVAEALIQKLGF